MGDHRLPNIILKKVNDPDNKISVTLGIYGNKGAGYKTGCHVVAHTPDVKNVWVRYTVSPVFTRTRDSGYRRRKMSESATFLFGRDKSGSLPTRITNIHPNDLGKVSFDRVKLYINGKNVLDNRRPSNRGQIETLPDEESFPDLIEAYGMHFSLYEGGYQAKRFPYGYTVLNKAGKEIKVVREDSTLTIASSTEKVGVIYYITKWSFLNAAKGGSPTLIRANQKPSNNGNPLKSSFMAEVKVTKLPEAITMKTTRERKILSYEGKHAKYLAPKTPMTVVATIEKDGQTYMMSDWSYKNYKAGKPYTLVGKTDRAGKSTFTVVKQAVNYTPPMSDIDEDSKEFEPLGIAITWRNDRGKWLGEGPVQKIFIAEDEELAYVLNYVMGNPKKFAYLTTKEVVINGVARKCNVYLLAQRVRNKKVGPTWRKNLRLYYPELQGLEPPKNLTWQSLSEN